MNRIDPTETYRLPEPDSSVPQQGDEGWTHWSTKASIVAWLRSIDGVSGRIEPETKVEDLIPDVKCDLDDSIKGLPKKCVFEVQTRECQTNLLQRIRRLNRHGYTVYYVYPDSASNYRRRLSKRLGEEMSERPTLGRVSDEGELRIGTPLVPGALDTAKATTPWAELYIPTHKRSAQAYDFGDFLVESVRTALVCINGYLYMMEEVDSTGQRTLPTSLSLSKRELYDGIMNGEITRESPVRGTPKES